MVKKFTLFELHLDNARFSNAVGKLPEEAATMLDEMDAIDVDADDLDDVDADELDELIVEGPTSSERSVGRRLAQAAFLVVLAVGIRTVARRLLASNDEGTMDDTSEDSISVDLDDRVEA